MGFAEFPGSYRSRCASNFVTLEGLIYLCITTSVLAERAVLICIRAIPVAKTPDIPSSRECVTGTWRFFSPGWSPRRHGQLLLIDFLVMCRGHIQTQAQPKCARISPPSIPPEDSRVFKGHGKPSNMLHVLHGPVDNCTLFLVLLRQILVCSNPKCVTNKANLAKFNLKWLRIRRFSLAPESIFLQFTKASPSNH